MKGGSGEICRFSMALLEENGQAIFGGWVEKGNDTIFSEQGVVPVD